MEFCQCNLFIIPFELYHFLQPSDEQPSKTNATDGFIVGAGNQPQGTPVTTVSRTIGALDRAGSPNAAARLLTAEGDGPTIQAGGSVAPQGQRPCIDCNICGNGNVNVTACNCQSNTPWYHCMIAVFFIVVVGIWLFIQKFDYYWK